MKTQLKKQLIFVAMVLTVLAAIAFSVHASDNNGGIQTTVCRYSFPKGFSDPYLARGLSENGVFAGTVYQESTGETLPFVGTEAGIGFIDQYFSNLDHRSVWPVAVSQTGYVAIDADNVNFVLVHGRLLSLPCPENTTRVRIRDIADVTYEIDGKMVTEVVVLGRGFSLDLKDAFPIVWRFNPNDEKTIVETFPILNSGCYWLSAVAVSYSHNLEKLYIVGTTAKNQRLNGVFASVEINTMETMPVIYLGKTVVINDVNSKGYITGKAILNDDGDEWETAPAIWKYRPKAHRVRMSVIPIRDSRVGYYSPEYITDKNEIAIMAAGSEGKMETWDRWPAVVNAKKTTRIFNYDYDWDKSSINWFSGINNRGWILSVGSLNDDTKLSVIIFKPNILSFLQNRR